MTDEEALLLAIANVYPDLAGVQDDTKDEEDD